jgi:hypothetical protein
MGWQDIFVTQVTVTAVTKSALPLNQEIQKPDRFGRCQPFGEKSLVGRSEVPRKKLFRAAINKQITHLLRELGGYSIEYRGFSLRDL